MQIRRIAFLLAGFGLLVIALAAQAQTTASCTYSSFSAPSGYSWPGPNGNNDYGTIVGNILSPPIDTVSYRRGMIHYSGGGTTTYNYPGAQDTWFSKRNNAGVTVGYWDTSQPTFHGLVMSGSKVVQVDYPHGSERNTWLYGINKWGSIVGVYVTWINGNFTSAGFKLQNGHYTQIKFPASNLTHPLAINDNGTIVGWYSNTANGDPYLYYKGFILQNGTYKTLNDPMGTTQNGTQLNDMNNNGVIVGNWVSEDAQGLDVPHGFIYKNGVFEHLAYPGAKVTSAYGINNYGTVVGQARMPANNGFGYNIVPFKAYCK